VAPMCKLLLAGDGPLRKQLEELALTLRGDKRIEFLGWQARHQIVKLLRGCTAFVLPSRSEPFGIAVIEALACTKPVIATRVGGIPEIIENGENGVLVEPDDANALAEALTDVLTDPALQKTLAANGYVTVDKLFRCEHTGASYEAVFTDVLAAPVGSESSERVSG
jgi:glycosyltransferase involved in cell wall biosynthesis